jgi:hypothetical protein
VVVRDERVVLHKDADSIRVRRGRRAPPTQCVGPPLPCLKDPPCGSSPRVR